MYVLKNSMCDRKSYKILEFPMELNKTYIIILYFSSDELKTTSSTQCPGIQAGTDHCWR